MTKLQESSVWITAESREIVPRHVCDISAWFLDKTIQLNLKHEQPTQDDWQLKITEYCTYYVIINSPLVAD